MESGLIKIRCGFEVQDRKKFTEAVVKEKVILLNKDTLNLAFCQRFKTDIIRMLSIYHLIFRSTLEAV